MNETTRALTIESLNGWYGESHILQGVSFSVAPGEIVTLVGRNGAGKTTTLRAIMGLLPKREGSIRIGSAESIRAPARVIARMGVGYVPEERVIFASLDVFENLMLPPKVREGGLSVTEIYELFPNLRERARSRGGKLSGGEQQMLAIARILRTGAKLLLMDEPTEGLAPVIVREIGRTIAYLKGRGFTIVLVEQNLKFAERVSDRHFVLEQGRIVDAVDKDGFKREAPKLQRYLGV